ncbi:MAG TPA: hypothetical protein VII11_04525 [Bacteroidota bacterium]
MSKGKEQESDYSHRSLLDKLGVKEESLVSVASGLIDKIGEENLCGDIDEAHQRSKEI